RPVRCRSLLLRLLPLLFITEDRVQKILQCIRRRLLFLFFLRLLHLVRLLWLLLRLPAQRTEGIGEVTRILQLHLRYLLQMRREPGVLKRAGDKDWDDQLSFFVGKRSIKETANIDASHCSTVVLRKDSGDMQVQLLLRQVNDPARG